MKMAITRKDPIHLKWISSQIFSKSGKFEKKNSPLKSSREFVKPLREAAVHLETHLIGFLCKINLGEKHLRGIYKFFCHIM